MFATSISGNGERTALEKYFPRFAILSGLLAVMLPCCHIGAGAAETNLVSTNSFPATSNSLQAAQKKLLGARAAFLANTNDAVKAWQLGRACFEQNEAAKDIHQQENIAKEGIAACRQAVALAPKSAAGHYYLGLTLGQFADTKRNMAALKMVKEMEREFLQTLELDEHFDFAGADRNLGILYFESPSVISIGSHSKAKKHLQRAVELAPDFPENHLNLIEILPKLGDDDAARRELRELEKIWPAAQEKFKGDEWAASRTDWQMRLNAAKAKPGK